MARLSIGELRKPVLTYRFKVMLLATQGGTQLFVDGQGHTHNSDGSIIYAKGISLPAIQSDTIELRTGPSVFAVRGRTRYEPLTLTMYAYEKTAFKGVLTWFELHHGDLAGGDEFTTENFQEGWYDEYKADLQIHLTDEKMETTEIFTCGEAYLQSVNFGTVDYEQEAIIQCQLTIGYRWLRRSEQ